MRKKGPIGVAAVLSAIFVLAACSSDNSTAGGTTPPPTSPAAADGTVSVLLSQWSVAPSASSAPAGSITFSVTNEGTMIHEFVVERTDTLAADIPVKSFEGEADRIDEDTAGTNDGETGDMAAGATQSLTVDLKPGHYVFFCNLPGHYAQGMHLDFTVT
ncbi:MAG: cupredoxin domain-containing protein [Actinomycetota bacterium]|nr:cupredoxin domain-containing protein [Actinomycetota bacterium]